MAGPVTAVYWLRRAAALAGDEKTGNAVGTILTAFLLPFILIIVCLCGMMDAAADHNRAAVEWCFGDGAIPAAAPEEYAGHITQMRACFAVLDGAVGKLNAELEEGSVPLRANRVKADFFALNSGSDAPPGPGGVFRGLLCQRSGAYTYCGSAESGIRPAGG